MARRLPHSMIWSSPASRSRSAAGISRKDAWDAKKMKTLFLLLFSIGIASAQPFLVYAPRLLRLILQCRSCHLYNHRTFGDAAPLSRQPLMRTGALPIAFKSGNRQRRGTINQRPLHHDGVCH